MRFLLLFIAAAKVAMACSCSSAAYAPLCQRIDRVKVLFVGTAIATNDNHDGFLKGGLWYRFTVDEPFKGIDAATREVIVDPASGTSCQTGFMIGRRYLISSYGDTISSQNSDAVTVGGFPPAGRAPRPKGPVVFTGVCGGSSRIEDAAEEIRYIRQYKAGLSVESIYGFARIHASEWLWSDRYPPLSGAVVRINGPGGPRLAKTGLNGRYEFPNVTAGTYRLTVEAPGFTPTRSSYDVEVPARGCGVTNIGMFSDGGISGTVLDEHGAPAGKVSVEYRLRDRQVEGPRFDDRSTKTNERGQFHFARVPPGEFLVGVHIDTAPKAQVGIPPTYWPGTGDAKTAGVVRLAPNQKKTDLVIRLGPRAGVRKVRVRVQWPDGRPAAAARVSAIVNRSAAEFGLTDPSGTIEFSLLDGVEYTIDAFGSTRYRIVNGFKIGVDPVHAERQILPAYSSPAGLVLVLNQPAPRP